VPNGEIMVPKPRVELGIEALMLITTNPQQTPWETVLPPGYQDLPRELAAVDALLDDPVFFQPYRAHFSAEFGRPSIPLETYLRMMFLEAPLPAGLPDAVPGGRGLVVVVAVLPGPARLPGAAPVHVGEDHHPVWAGDDRQVERGVAGQGGRGEGGAPE
jgi:hypothetical protein